MTSSSVEQLSKNSARSGVSGDIAGDHLHNLLGRRRSGLMIAFHNTMTQDHDAVRHLEGVQHVVGDDDDCDPLFPDTIDEFETPAGLFDPKRRERFVQYYKLSAPIYEPAQLDRLALTA